eukprot:jgi/Bigna1/143875/aug1.82_g18583
MGPETSTYYAEPRGYTFQAPCGLTISSVYVHGNVLRSQYVVIYRSSVNYEETPAETQNPVVLFQSGGTFSGSDWIPVNIDISAGDFIGVLGYRRSGSSIEVSYTTQSLIRAELGCSQNFAIERLVSSELQVFPPASVSREPSTDLISRIDMNFTAPPSPVPVLARIVNSLAGIEVSYSSPTAQPLLPCSSFLTPASLALIGTMPSCTWAQPDVLYIHFGDSATAVVGNELAFEGRLVVDPHGRFLVYNPSVEIQAPLQPRALSLNLIGAQSLGPCHATATYETQYNSNRTVSVQWELIKRPNATGIVPSPYAAINAVLAAATTDSITIPIGALLAGDYVLKAKATTWINSTAEALLNFTRSTNILLTSSAPDFITITRSTRYSVQVRIADSSCLSNTNLDSSTSLLIQQTLWRQALPGEYLPQIGSRNLIGDDVIEMANKSVLALSFNPYTLPDNATYGFVFSVNLTDSSGVTYLTEHKNFSVEVVSKRLEAVILGGHAIRFVPEVPSSSVVFNASRSFDPNVDVHSSSSSSISSSSSLIYSWNVADTADPTWNLPAGPDVASSALTLQTSTLQAGKRYKVNVSVAEASSSPSSSDSAAQMLEIVPGVGLTVSMDNVPFQERINPTQSLSLIANVQGQYEFLEYNWTVARSNSSFPFEPVDGASSVTSYTGKYLAISELSAPPFIPGSSYVFSVTATAMGSGVGAGGLRGMSTMTLTLNSPPRLGTCSCTPSTGMVVSTVFKLNCSGWMDAENDFPLQYLFQLVASNGSESATTTTNVLDLSSLQLSNELYTVLPPPLSTEGSNANGLITLRTLVSDSLGSSNPRVFTANVQGTIDAFNITKILLQLQEKIDQRELEQANVLFAVALNYTDTESYSSSHILERQYVRQRLSALILSYARAAEPVVETRPVELDPWASTALILKGIASFHDIQESTETMRDNVLDTATLLIGSRVLSSSVLPNLLNSALGVQNQVSQLGTDAEKRIVSGRTEAICIDGAQLLLRGTVPGEESKEIILGQETAIVAKRFGSAEAASERNSMSSSVGANFSFRLPMHLPASTVDALCFYSRIPTYPGRLATGTLSIELRAEGQVIAPLVTESNPYELNIPAIFTNGSYCQFYNITTQNWDNKGMTFSGYTENPDGIRTMLCQSTHLTSFSGSDYAININDVGPLKAEVFALEQPVMIFNLALFALYILVIVGWYLCCNPRWSKLPVTQLEQSNKFWIRMVWASHAKVYGERSWRALGRMLYWGFRNYHPWLACIMHDKADYIGFIKRWTLLMVIMFNSAAISTLLLGTEQQLFGMPRWLAASIIGTILSFPIPIIIKKAYDRRSPEEYRVAISDRRIGCVRRILIFISGIIGKTSIEIRRSQPRGSNRNSSVSSAGSYEKNNALRRRDIEMMESQMSRQSDIKGLKVEMKDNAKIRSIRVDSKFDNILKPYDDTKRTGDSRTSDSRTSDSRTSDSRTSQGNRYGDNVRLSVLMPETALGANGDVLGTITEANIPPKKTSCCRSFCCYPDDDGKLDSHDIGRNNFKYNFWDRVTLAASIIIILGCWLVIAGITYNAVKDQRLVLPVILLTWFEDFCVRTLIITILHVIFFCPFCCCCTAKIAPRTRKKKKKKNKKKKLAVAEEFIKSVTMDEEDPGFDTTELYVTKVYPRMQGDRVGVLPGWRVVSVDSLEVYSDQMFMEVLSEKNRIYKEFKITFEAYYGNSHVERQLKKHGHIAPKKQTTGQNIRVAPVDPIHFAATDVIMEEPSDQKYHGNNANPPVQLLRQYSGSPVYGTSSSSGKAQGKTSSTTPSVTPSIRIMPISSDRKGISAKKAATIMSL